MTATSKKRIVVSFVFTYLLMWVLYPVLMLLAGKSGEQLAITLGTLIPSIVFGYLIRVKPVLWGFLFSVFVVFVTVVIVITTFTAFLTKNLGYLQFPIFPTKDLFYLVKIFVVDLGVPLTFLTIVGSCIGHLIYKKTLLISQRNHS